MADPFLLSAIRTVIELAAELTCGVSLLPSDVEKYCRKLYNLMLRIGAIVEDAEERSRVEPTVREMMHSLRNPVYEAEDLLKKLNSVVSRKNRAEAVLQRDTWLFLLGWSALKDRIMFRFYGKKLNEIFKKIEAVFAEMNPTGLLERPFSEAQQAVPYNTPFLAELTVSGRSDDLKNIEAIVLGQSESDRVVVLPIVGMAGMGKTTVARCVYNSEILREHFQVKRWVLISYSFDVPHVLKSIIDPGEDKLPLDIIDPGEDKLPLDIIDPGEDKLPLDNLELLSQRLREVLSDKRYLLVLDDLWNESRVEWEQLMLLLSCGGPGSTVIVTTRSDSVASLVATTSPYHLERVNESDWWNIFKIHAFRGGDEQPQFVEIGKRMMVECNGLPLAAMVLGGILSSKKKEREWLDVFHRTNDIMSILQVSYANLRSHLKVCFAFCAVFPEDFVIERNTLIQLWMAHSYIETEDKGVEFFDELVERAFFQRVRKEEEVEYLFEPTLDVCRMHDLLYDLAQALVGNRCASLLNLDQQSGMPNEALHVSSSNTEDIISLFKKNSRVSFHTILSLSDSYHTAGSTVQVDLSKANSSRAISLRNAPIEEIRIVPGKLTHLRYLDLSYCIWLKVLPESLCTVDLQTLKLSGCCHLEFLPKGMRHMRSLRHLYLDGCDGLKCMPECLGQLTCLQTLTRYIVDPSIGCGIEELQSLKLRGHLELYHLENVTDKQNAELANLISKKELTQLELWWADTSSLDPAVARDTLKGLQPHQGLQVLKIGHYNGDQFSTWMHQPNMLENLTKLMLNDCRRCTTLPSFWHLPSLKVLYLWFLKSLKYLCCDSALLAPEDDQVLHMFPKLEFLYMVGMPELECWQENDEAKLTSLACPQLHSLVIKNCPNLKVLPSCPLLNYLEIKETKIPSSIIESFKNNGVDIYI